MMVINNNLNKNLGVEFTILYVYFIIGVNMRPSELFNSKLTPLLKEKGIVNMENRKEWPLSILKDVLVTLMNETPKNLLSKYV